MNANGIKILIVEHAADDSQSAAAMLKQNKLTNNLLLFSDGNKALDYLFRAGAYASKKNEEQPRLILLDMEIPASPGIDILHHIKSDHRTRTIPVVVMVSSASDPVLQKCIALGVSDFILKPPGFGDFARVMVQMGLSWKLLHMPQAGSSN